MGRHSNSTRANEIPVTLNNPAFCIYLIVSCLLVIKVMAVAILTMYNRSVHKVFLSPEDALFNKGQVLLHDAVERTRRAHLNDLENIPIFIAASFAYLWTNPKTWLVAILYFGFLLMRTLHTIFYTVLVPPQPSRSVVYIVGFLITWYIALHSMVIGFKYLF